MGKFLYPKDIISNKLVTVGYNFTNEDIIKGVLKVVKSDIENYQGYPRLIFAKGDSAENYETILGVVSSGIRAFDQGFVVKSGSIQNIDTQKEGWVSGGTLWLSETDFGELTAQEPSSTTKIRIGYIGDIDYFKGTIEVDIEVITSTTPVTQDINTLGLEYGLPLNAAPWGTSTTGVYSVAANSTSGEIYVPNYGASIIRVYNSDRTLNRDIATFANPSVIRFNQDQTLYGVLRSLGGTNQFIRVYNTSDDSVAYNITQNGAQIAFDFSPANTNVFYVNLLNTVTEKTDANALVSTTFTISNISRARMLKAQPLENRIWVGGDGGNSNSGRLSYFDANSRTVTDIITGNVGPTDTTIGLITGMSFFGSRIFLHHTSATLNSTINSKMITEINDTGTFLNQWLIFGNTNNYSDGTIYEHYTEPVILYGIIDDKTVNCVGTLILP